MRWSVAKVSQPSCSLTRSHPLGYALDFGANANGRLLNLRVLRVEIFSAGNTGRGSST